MHALRGLLGESWPPTTLPALGCGLALCCGLALGCGPPLESPKPEPPKVTVAPAIKRLVVDYDEYTGRIASKETVEVRARATGYLLQVPFNDGDMVTAGEVLFKIDPSTYQAAYDQAVAQIALWDAKYKFAEATRKRSEKLRATGSVSVEEYEENVANANQALAAMKAAEADAAAQKINLDFCTVYSPIDGKIDRTLVTKGNLVESSGAEPTLLTTIVAVDPIYVYFDIDELALLRYTARRQSEEGVVNRVPLRDKHIPVQIALADQSVYPEVATVDFGSNQVDSGTGTLTARAVVGNPEGMLTPGLFVRVKITAGPPYEAILVADQAIGTDQSERFVYVVDSTGSAQRRPVVLGAKQGSDRVIKSGLAAGEKVIINGLLLVRTDKPVTAEPGQMPEPPAVDERLLRGVANGSGSLAPPAAEPATTPIRHEVRKPVER